MMTETQGAATPYYVPNPSIYPVIVNIGLFFLGLGFVLKLNALGGVVLMLLGATVTIYGSFAWINTVICENEKGLYHKWEDRSFRVGMGYFIGAEIAFFASFLFALMYLRIWGVEGLGTAASELWQGYKAAWPTSGPAGKAFTPLNAWGVPAVNTLLLILSAAAVIWARTGIAQSNRGQMTSGLLLTLALGGMFIVQQFMEYGHAASELGVMISTGAYGTMFYMLTGIHGFHLIIGLTMLVVILLRCLNGHFDSEHHFGLDAVAWYWNFVVVAPGLLVFIYFYWL